MFLKEIIKVNREKRISVVEAPICIACLYRLSSLNQLLSNFLLVKLTGERAPRDLFKFKS